MDGTFQASNVADFSRGVMTAFTVIAAPFNGAPATYRYWRYVVPANSYGDIADFQLFG